ncbi:hypothetical protein GCM10017556_28620 [Micromonospora sagamiensis]|uniref:Uncharacterized protein n=2 Tax=Micromonospora sagamiensis TaxID=47875 RepID=A0A562WN93_9ACTN|nr:hypothetical protein JD81_05385 [Micromonospora sagamiensis]BCL15123.1 hypothetical protein GCM10017556_28620 [Micromonospora sagamiensis]
MQPDPPKPPTIRDTVRSNALFYMRLSLSYFDLVTGITVRSYRRDRFHTASIGSSIVKWNYDNPEQAIRDLTANNGEAVMKFVEAAAPYSKKPGRLGSSGVTDCLVGEGFHMYTHVSNAVPVPAPFQPVFGNIRSWLPFRAMLSVFPPAGGEVPDLPRFGRLLIDDPLAEDLTREWEHDHEIVEYRQKRLTGDVPVSGPVALGNVFVKASRATILDGPRYTVRYSLMSTSELHALDGEALWMQVYDKTDHTTAFLAVGGGRDNLWGIDKLNNRTAGLVFSTMHHTFGALMGSVAKSSDGVRELTDGVPGIAWSQSLQLLRDNPALGTRRGLAGGFDVLSRVVALMRRGAGMNVVDSPDGDDDLVEISVTVDPPVTRFDE